MNGADGESIKKAVLAKGIDALGWYVPFHAKGVQWGIYVPASGLACLIANVFADLPVDLPTRLLIAFRAGRRGRSDRLTHTRLAPSARPCTSLSNPLVLE